MSTLLLIDDIVRPRLDHAAQRDSARQPAPRTIRRIEDRQYAVMEAVYSQAGGLATDDAVARRMRRHASQPVSILAHWIIERSVVCFPWNSRTMIPLFQFEQSDMTLHAGTVDVQHELVDVFDDWELAVWFVRPNAWLGDATPVDMIRRDQPAVYHAARADRYIARG